LLDHLTQYENKLDNYLSEFEERDLVYEERAVPELEYAFKHAFTQEATYQGILERGRRAFHSQVALGIEKIYQERLEDYYDELAHHYSRSDDPEKAIEYLLKAGEKAKRNYANDTAISYYQNVLELLDQHSLKRDDWKLEVLEALGQIYHRTGKVIEAENIFEQAIEIAKEMNLPPRRIAKLYFWISDTIWWQGKYDDIIRYGKMGLEILGDDTECLESALVNTMLVVANSNIGNWVEATQYVHKNINFIKKLDYTVELRTAYVHIIMMDGDPNSAWEWTKELKKRAEKINDQTGLASAWLRQGIILESKSDYVNALVMHNKSIDTFQNIGDAIGSMSPYLGAARALFNLGDIAESIKNAQLSLEITERCGQKLFIAMAHDILANISMCQQHWDDAIYHYQKYVEIRKEIDNVNNPVLLAWRKFQLGNIYMKKGDYDKAIEIFHEFADKNVQYGLFSLLEALEYIYRSLGKRDEFLDFCKSYREKHAESMKELPLQQWYLEPAPISEKYSNLTFTDDLDNEPLDSSWTWLNPLDDCSYKAVKLDDGLSALEISAVNGRILVGNNMSAPRFLRLHTQRLP
ncbi:tetratricopeptide repeat protein, partial [Dolichospermum sp. ST_sed3]|nr:tetratricopeptide repeat protein [Dolichospermum sp. ST_sed3]